MPFDIIYYWVDNNDVLLFPTNSLLWSVLLIPCIVNDTRNPLLVLHTAMCGVGINILYTCIAD